LTYLPNVQSDLEELAPDVLPLPESGPNRTGTADRGGDECQVVLPTATITSTRIFM